MNVGVLAFNHHATVLQSPTRNRADARAAIDRMAVSGGTATGEAIASALTRAAQRARRGRQTPARRDRADLRRHVDRRARPGRHGAPRPRRLRIPIYTVALGTDQGTIRVPGRGGAAESRARPARRRGARGDRATPPAARPSPPRPPTGLDAVYERLGSQLGRRDEHRQVTAAFAAGGLVLLLAGAALSLRWFGRLI